jgi:glycerol uptake facilitator-like aquaporin
MTDDVLQSRMSAQHVPSLGRRLTAEGLGTAALLTAVVGSGIMGERLSGGNAGIALLANSISTGAALVVLILAFAPISGAHFNPVVSGVAAGRGELTWGTAGAYGAAQIAGAFTGVVCAHVMFGEPLMAWSTHARSGLAQTFSEAVATFGLVLVILATARQGPWRVACAVGAYITAAYWFTASTSFANPAVTLARSITNTFTGIRPADVGPFLVAQVVGATGAALLSRWLVPPD